MGIKKVRCVYEVDMQDEKTCIVDKFTFTVEVLPKNANTQLLDVPEIIKAGCESQLLKLFGVSENPAPKPVIVPKQKPTQHKSK